MTGARTSTSSIMQFRRLKNTTKSTPRSLYQYYANGAVATAPNPYPQCPSTNLPVLCVFRFRQILEQMAMQTLRGALQGVFFLPCKVACLHGVVTLLSFLTLQIEFPYFAAFMVSSVRELNQ